MENNKVEIKEIKKISNRDIKSRPLGHKNYCIYRKLGDNGSRQYYDMNSDGWEKSKGKCNYKNVTDLIRACICFIIGQKYETEFEMENERKFAESINDLIKKLKKYDFKWTDELDKGDTKWFPDNYKTESYDNKNEKKSNGYCVECNNETNKIIVLKYLSELAENKESELLCKNFEPGYDYFIEWEDNQDSNNEQGENKDMSDMKDNGIEEIVKNAINENKQVIFTGAPGTGKTYSVKKQVEALTQKDENRYKFVQFHPSYDYTDFVEGLRPVRIKESDADVPAFVRLDGIFKEFCRHIVEENLKYALGVSEDTEFKELFDKLENDEPLSDDEEERLRCELEKIYQNKAEKDRVEKFKNGKDKYYFIVDEINRADLSKVFGELMFALEESYRGIENRFDTQYKNLKTYKIDKNGKAGEMEFDCFEKGFFIPHNLYFIGTMNDIDRSVESFDFALRRRFQWIEIKANDIMKTSLRDMQEKELIGENEDDIEILTIKIQNMNNVLARDVWAETNSVKNAGLGEKYGLTAAYHIGPAYFKGLGKKETTRLENIFERRIEPIIREYLRGRAEKDINVLIKECKGQLCNKDNKNSWDEGTSK